MDQKERMLANLPYKSWMDGLSEDRMECKKKLYKYNNLPPEETAEREKLLREILGKTKEGYLNICYRSVYSIICALQERKNDEYVPSNQKRIAIAGRDEILKNLASEYSCIDNVELLPFKKICKSKYNNMGKDFPFDAFDTPSGETMQKLQSKL